MSKQSGSNNTYGTSTQGSSGGSGMLQSYIYDTSSVHERQFQPGQAPTPAQQRQNMQRTINTFDRQYNGHGASPTPRR